MSRAMLPPLSVEQHIEYRCKVPARFGQQLLEAGVRHNDVSCDMQPMWLVAANDVCHDYNNRLINQLAVAFDRYPGCKWITFYS